MQYAQASIFLVKTLTNLYMLLFVLRIVLQWVRADFYNPLSQFVLRATGPLVDPLRRIVPRSRTVDVPTLLVLIVLEGVSTWLLLRIAGATVPPGALAFFVVLRLIGLVLWMYIVAVFVYAIMSWFSQGGYSPFAKVLSDVVGPILSIVRRFIPPLGGIDLSPLIIIIVFQAVALLLPLPTLLR